MKEYYTKVKELIEDIKTNEKIKTIVENEFIPVDITFKYEEGKEKIFELTKSKTKEKLFEDKIIYEDPKKNIFH